MAYIILFYLPVWKCMDSVRTMYIFHADDGMAVLPLQTQCSYGDPDSLEFALDGRMYELEYQVVDGDMDPPEYALAGADLSAQGE